MKNYSDLDYAEAASQANKESKMLYVMRTVLDEYKDVPREDLKEFMYIDSLMIGLVNYYVTLKDNNVTFGDLNPDYEDEKFEEFKKSKMSELDSNLQSKSSDTKSTITINLPGTVLVKDNEEITADSFKLLTVTSGGTLQSVLADLKDMPDALLFDVLVTDDGYTVKNLKEVINYLGAEVKRIYAIWALCGLVRAQITNYYRQTKEAIAAAETYDELNAITIDFDQF